MRKHSLDKIFLLATALLIVTGFFIFSSAAMGLAVRSGISYTSLIAKQFFIGFVAGGILLFSFATLNYQYWRTWALWLFVAAMVLCAAVFLPKIGFAYNGARRWIGWGPISFQPSELLKFASVLYFAGWIATVKKRIATFRYGALPLMVILAIIGALLIKEPDTGTCAVLVMALLAMFICAGGRWRHVALIILIGLLVLGGLLLVRPYLMQRIVTFLHPSEDALGSGYQIQQSLIAVGSGQVFGRGFGQSIQKFNFLPEPVGDSIFAVAAEEFGFVGSVVLLGLIVFFALRGFKIAAGATDSFASSVAVGFITLIVLQSFVNIGAMLAVLPLTGIPLIFVSQGGTAMLFALAEVGIVLNISKNIKTKRLI